MIFIKLFCKAVYTGLPFLDNSSSINARELRRVKISSNHEVQALSVVYCAPDILLVHTSLNSSVHKS